VRRDQRRVQVDHDLADPLAGGAGCRQLGAGELTAGQPDPVPSLRPALPDRREHAGVGGDAGQHPPDRRSRRDRSGWAVQALLIGEGLHVTDRDSAIGDRDRHINQHPARVVTSAAFPEAVGGLA
jgi:hypothetical protein